MQNRAMARRHRLACFSDEGRLSDGSLCNAAALRQLHDADLFVHHDPPRQHAWLDW